MKTSIQRLFVCVLLVICATTIRAQWTYCSGPHNGAIGDLLVHQGNLYATTIPSGVWRSTDNGNSWAPLSPDKQGAGKLLATGPDLFALAGRVNISTNCGDDWNELNAGLEGQAIRMIGANDSVLFVATNTGMFRSLDRGTTWSRVDTTLKIGSPHSFAVCGDKFYAEVAAACYVTTDYGSSWTSVNSGLPTPGCWNLISIEDVLYGSTLQGLYRFNERESKWVDVHDSPPWIGVHTLIEDGANICAMTKAEARLSINYGDSWITLNKTIPYDSITSLAHNDAYIFIGSKNGKVYRSGDQGRNWVEANSGLTRNQFNAIDGFENVVYAGSEYYGLFRSLNDGLTWVRVDAGLNEMAISTLQSDGPVIYVGTLRGYISRSDDSGSSWQSLFGRPWSGRICDILVTKRHVFAATSGGVYRSSDRGITWDSLDLRSDEFPVSTLAVKGDIIYAGGKDGVRYSDDYGSRWKSLSHGLDSLPIVYAIHITDNGIMASCLNAIFVLAQGDTTWKITSPRVFNGHERFLASDGSSIFVSTFHRLYQTRLDGSNLTPVPDSTKRIHSITAFAIVGQYLYAGLKNFGVIRRPLSELVTSVDHANIRTATEVSNESLRLQIFPNPFSHSTTIELKTESTDGVTVTISTVTGEHVATLQTESGNVLTHTLQWDASGLPEGMYYAHVRCAGQTQTSPIIIAR